MDSSPPSTPDGGTHTSRSLVLCSEDLPTSPVSETAVWTRGTDGTNPKLRNPPRKRESSAMYFFHSSHVPAGEEDGTSGEGLGGRKCHSQAPTTMASPGPQHHARKQQQQHPSHMAPSHYSLGRLSHSQHTTNATATPTTSALKPAPMTAASADGAGAALVTPTPASQRSTPSPEGGRPSFLTSAFPPHDHPHPDEELHPSVTAGVGHRISAAALLYDHPSTESELMAAIRSRKRGQSLLPSSPTSRTAPAAAARADTGGAVGVDSLTSPVYGGLPSRQQQQQQQQRDDRSNAATVADFPPRNDSFLHLSTNSVTSSSPPVSQTDRQQRSPQQPPQSSRPPPPPLGLTTASARNIPYSTDSPNRSALPSHENSMMHIPVFGPGTATPCPVEAVAMPTAAVTNAPTGHRDRENSDSLTPASDSGGTLPPLPPSPLNQQQHHLRGEDDDDTTREVHTVDAMGLEPVLASSMPQGRYVVLNLLSSWGDEHEIGLCGVEFFNERGEPLLLPPTTLSRAGPTKPGTSDERKQGQGQDDGTPPSTQSLSIDRGVVSLGCTVANAHQRTSPSSSSSSSGAPVRGTGVHVIAEYTASGEELLALGDAGGLETMRTDRRRQLSSLINGRTNTHDEEEMLALPFTPGQHHLICFMFQHAITLSMIRLVNYCGQGRVHTTKGARVVEITMDDVCIFRGEVRQHSGEWLSDPNQEGLQDCENILFTDDRHILERIMARRTAASEASDEREGDCYEAESSPHAGSRRVTLIIRNTDWNDVDELAATVPASARLLPTCSMPAAMANWSGLEGGGEMAQAMPQRPASMNGDLGGAGGSDCGAPLRLQKRQHHHQQPPPPSGHPAAVGGRRQQSASSPSTRAPVGCEQPLSSRHGRSAWDANGDQNSEPAAALPAQQQQQRQHRPRKPALYPTHCPTNVTSACILLLSTWGDVQQVGLRGLRLRDAKGELISEAVSRWTVQYPDGSHATPRAQSQLAAQAQLLLDAKATTGCVLPFLPAMQLVMEFTAPIASLGFLEVANYSVGDRTYCGAKEVRLFLSDSPFSPHTSVAPVYRKLWTVGTSSTSRRALQRARVFEVTPSEGVSLRKAPASLSAPRFQTYDLSLQAPPGPLEAAATTTTFPPGISDSAHPTNQAGPSSDISSPRYHISAGPGTGGGAARSDSLGTCTQGGGGGGMQLFVGTASFTNSLNASMNIRATMAMKRARMSLKERPLWLLDYQPYITPLLPVGYVVKVRLSISARSVGQVERRRGSGGQDTAPAAAGSDVYLSNQVVLKSYLRDWVLHPLASCSFVNESGKVIRPIRPGDEPPQPPAASALSDPQQQQREEGTDTEEEDENLRAYIPMVAECVLTTNPSTGPAAASPHQTQQQCYLNVVLELVYVADTPFCLSVINLRRPLVLPGSAAWVRQVQVRMDDTLVYDSGDAVLELKKPARLKEVVRGRDGHAPLRDKKTKAAAADEVFTVGELCEQGPASAALTAGLGLVPCTTSLKESIIFTLDRDILAQLKDKIKASR